MGQALVDQIERVQFVERLDVAMCMSCLLPLLNLLSAYAHEAMELRSPCPGHADWPTMPLLGHADWPTMPLLSRGLKISKLIVKELPWRFALRF